MSGGGENHSNTEHSTDFTRVYRAVAAARRQLSSGRNTESNLLSNVRSSFSRRRRNSSMNLGDGRRRGRKPGLKWQVKLFLLEDPNQTTIPSSQDSEELEKSGLGSGNSDLGHEHKTVDLSWSLAELNTFICQSFESVSLNVTGFRLARATKAKKLLVVQANSVKDLKRQIGRSRLYILPNSNLSLSRQDGESLNESSEGRSSVSSAAVVSLNVHSEMVRSAVTSVESNIVDLTDEVDGNRGYIYVNAGTPEVFYRTNQPVEGETTTQNRTGQSLLSESTLEVTLEHYPVASSPIHGSFPTTVGVSHSQFTAISEILQDSEPDEDTQMLSSPKRPYSPSNEVENLADIIGEFRKENISEHSTLIVVARRRRILHSAITALNKGYFDWHKCPRIEFVGEMADDFGGPTREFFRLLMKDVQSTLGIFEGQPGNLFFSYDQAALQKGKYYTGGKLIAWSLLHGGPSIKALHPSLYQLMCGQAPDLEGFDIASLPDNSVQDKLQQIEKCKTEEDWKDLQESLGDWIADCGVPGVYEAKVLNIPQIISQIVKHFIFHRTANMVEQFKQGINSCGKLWETVERYLKAFQCLFTHTEEQLTRAAFRCLFDIFWSDEGANNKEAEEDTIFAWECLLNSVQEKETPFTFEDLLVFVTGADAVPPLGFPQRLQIQFYDQEERGSRFPYASTCSMTLFLPRGVQNEGELLDLMTNAVLGSFGFGKV
ncbi:uncharacterized protein LOC143517694 isoform X2 [Brachyhypopomus gauderio]|uniref:uncharacterized protein LOC143517694 isoform X2 n=1 Tax=Brachyhypopomus gauderio TaxID=698409 RepID=UPI004042D1AD